ncbi:MAG: CpsD/CapB family tyrosine-protein kinase [Tissierellia bacterium]|nr:CpsD/CapB family tyrosine-protein kinase [Tissierellia bacterium]MDD4781818.1 CpsD/CapB family tyrosine-protein kinase [Tissierellia bacterium]
MEKFNFKDHKNSTIAESYRKIAANIEYANIDKNIKTIMLTSSLASEGKTTTVCNLAHVMADANKKMLILDLDLRKPAVHRKYNISNNVGLVDLLMNKDDFNNYVHNIDKNLEVITTGKIPTNPFEIINSKAIKELIKELSKYFDYILLDTPPIALVSDPITIATYADAVILTIAHGETEKEIARKSVASLKHVNANIIGTILNKVPVNKNNKYYYQYNYH